MIIVLFHVDSNYVFLLNGILGNKNLINKKIIMRISGNIAHLLFFVKMIYIPKNLRCLCFQIELIAFLLNILFSLACIDD